MVAVILWLGASFSSVVNFRERDLQRQRELNWAKIHGIAKVNPQVCLLFGAGDSCGYVACTVWCYQRILLSFLIITDYVKHAEKCIWVILAALCARISSSANSITAEKLPVCVLTRVAQIIPLHVETCKTACRDLLMSSDHKPKIRSVWPSLLQITMLTVSGEICVLFCFTAIDYWSVFNFKYQ